MDTLDKSPRENKNQSVQSVGAASIQESVRDVALEILQWNRKQVRTLNV